jgi:hypothetical protein
MEVAINKPAAIDNRCRALISASSKQHNSLDLLMFHLSRTVTGLLH